MGVADETLLGIQIGTLCLERGYPCTDWHCRRAAALARASKNPA